MPSSQLQPESHQPELREISPSFVSELAERAAGWGESPPHLRQCLVAQVSRYSINDAVALAGRIGVPATIVLNALFYQEVFQHRKEFVCDVLRELYNRKDEIPAHVRDELPSDLQIDITIKTDISEYVQRCESGHLRSFNGFKQVANSSEWREILPIVDAHYQKLVTTKSFAPVACADLRSEAINAGIDFLRRLDRAHIGEYYTGAVTKILAQHMGVSEADLGDRLKQKNVLPEELTLKLFWSPTITSAELNAVLKPLQIADLGSFKSAEYRRTDVVYSAHREHVLSLIDAELALKEKNARSAVLNPATVFQASFENPGVKPDGILIDSFNGYMVAGTLYLPGDVARAFCVSENDVHFSPQISNKDFSHLELTQGGNLRILKESGPSHVLMQVGKKDATLKARHISVGGFDEGFVEIDQSIGTIDDALKYRPAFAAAGSDQPHMVGGHLISTALNREETRHFVLEKQGDTIAELSFGKYRSIGLPIIFGSNKMAFFAEFGGDRSILVVRSGDRFYESPEIEEFSAFGSFIEGANRLYVSGEALATEIYAPRSDRTKSEQLLVFDGGKFFKSEVYDEISFPQNTAHGFVMRCSRENRPAFLAVYQSGTFKESASALSDGTIHPIVSLDGKLIAGHDGIIRAGKYDNSIFALMNSEGARLNASPVKRIFNARPTAHGFAGERDGALTVYNGDQVFASKSFREIVDTQPVQLGEDHVIAIGKGGRGGDTLIHFDGAAFHYSRPFSAIKKIVYFNKSPYALVETPHGKSVVDLQGSPLTPFSTLCECSLEKGNLVVLYGDKKTLHAAVFSGGFGETNSPEVTQLQKLREVVANPAKTSVARLLRQLEPKKEAVSFTERLKNSFQSSGSFTRMLTAALRAEPAVYCFDLPLDTPSHAGKFLESIIPELKVIAKGERQRSASPFSAFKPRQGLGYNGGNPDLRDNTVLLRLRRPSHDFFVTGVYFASDTATQRWQEAPVSFAAAERNSAQSRLETATVPVTQLRGEVMLPCPPGAAIIPERLKFRDKSERETTPPFSGASDVATTVIPAGGKELRYSYERPVKPPHLREISWREYNAMSERVKHGRAGLEQFVNLRAEDKMWVREQTSQTLPHEFVREVEQRINRIFYYDQKNGAVMGERETLSPQRFLESMRSRCDTLRADGTLVSTEAVYAGVCAERAFLTAAFLREAGIISGYVTGLLGNGSDEITAKNLHAECGVAWARRDGEPYLVVVASNPGRDFDEAETDLLKPETYTAPKSLAAIETMKNGVLERSLNAALDLDATPDALRQLNILIGTRYAQPEMWGSAEKKADAEGIRTLFKDEYSRSDRTAESSPDFSCGAEFFYRVEECVQGLASEYGSFAAARERFLRALDACRTASSVEMQRLARLTIRYIADRT